jgi:hypothetical protein
MLQIVIGETKSESTPEFGIGGVSHMSRQMFDIHTADIEFMDVFKSD